MGKVQSASNCFEHMILGMGKVEAPRYLRLPSWKQRQGHWRKWSYNQIVIRSIGQVSHHVSPDFLGVREPGKWGKLAHWIHLSYGHLRECYEFLHFSRLVLKTTVHLSKPAGCFRRISAVFFQATVHEIAACPHREKTCENCGKAPGLVSDPGWSCMLLEKLLGELG